MKDLLKTVAQEAFIAGMGRAMNSSLNKNWGGTWEELRKKYKI